MISKDVYANQILEMRRGAIVLAILSQLKAPHYGYGLLRALIAANIAVDAGTLYPLLRRLEKQGVLESSWVDTEGRQRKYYQLSFDGAALYGELAAEWSALSKAMEKVLIGEGQHGRG